MASMSKVEVIGITINMPGDGTTPTAEIQFHLRAKNSAGDPVEATATIGAPALPTDETSFEDELWNGSFKDAYNFTGDDWPAVPEWSPWPIV